MPRGGKREGAGRPVGTKKRRTVVYKTISISALPDEIEALKEAAKKSGKDSQPFRAGCRPATVKNN